MKKYHMPENDNDLMYAFMNYKEKENIKHLFCTFYLFGDDAVDYLSSGVIAPKDKISVDNFFEIVWNHSMNNQNQAKNETEFVKLSGISDKQWKETLFSTR